MKSLANPYAGAPRRWLRGNIHTHTTASDGQADPQAVVDWYAARGYDFLAVTDHNLLLPLEGLDAHGMLLVSGEELTHPRSHVVGLGLSATLPRGESLQEQIDLIRDAGGLASICHPNWMGLSVEQIAPIQGYLAIELSNRVCHRLNGKGDSVAWWDALLAQGRRCWGVAVDDCHDLAIDGGFGWILVAAADCSWPAICGALVAGCFVASMGPSFQRVAVDGRAVTVWVSDCREVRFIGSGGRALHKSKASPAGMIREASFELPGGEPFVRIEAEDANGARAWTQPLWEQP